MVYTNGAGVTQTAKLFKNGRSQAVRLPAPFRFNATEVYVRRDEATGDVILSQRPSTKNWAEFFAARNKRLAESPEEFEDFLRDRQQPPQQERDLF